VGTVLGLWPAWLLGGAVQELLFEVEPGDPAVFGGAAAALLASGLVACLVPALRAATVNPLVALRHD
jgi:ABC-type lipoprotein release transport system permease subunit